MKEYILNYCKKKSFDGMNDLQIYNWLCDTFWCNDYELLRNISFQLLKTKEAK